MNQHVREVVTSAEAAGTWRKLWRGLIFVVLLASLAGCAEDEAPRARTAVPADHQVSATPAGGGTIAAQVTNAGPADIEIVRVNKDVAQCEREQRIEKIVVGADNGLAGGRVPDGTDHARWQGARETHARSEGL